MVILRMTIRAQMEDTHLFVEKSLDPNFEASRRETQVSRVLQEDIKVNGLEG